MIVNVGEESAMAVEPNPFETLQQIAAGACLPRCLHVVAELGVADALGDAPRTGTELATSVRAHPDALHRILRLLSANGVFELRGSHVSHTPASRLLQADHPQSMKSLVLMFGLPINWSPYLHLRHTIETGQPASNKTLPGGYWNYFERDPAAAKIFNEAMAAKAKGQVAGIMAAYEFSRFRTIGDIGGGRGHLLSAVLKSTPAARGVLFDLPHVIRDASAIATDRLTFQAGDFFKDPLPACDLYLLMEVIHDWPDDKAMMILTAVRRAATLGATLLLLESIVPDDPAPNFTKTLDIVMLAFLGGKQRSRAEYHELLLKSGFSVGREFPTPAGISILEANAT
jgi:hypothetical protein